MMSQRACDRCHSIRARCQFSHGRDECDRCHRLHHDCRTDRKVLKAGRPRKTNAARKRRDTGASSTSDLTAFELDSLEGFSSNEVQLARYFLQNQRFENSFAGDSDLGTSMQDAPVRLLLSAPARIKDAMLALADAMIAEDANESAADAVASFDRCCKALERLRSAETTSVDDAKATLFAATSLISFNDMVIGHGFLPIARAALLSIEPWVNPLLEQDTFDPNLIPVMFAEVSEALKCREVPTLRYQPPQRRIIDPSYGIAQDLLPQFYDICDLGNQIKMGFLNSYEILQQALTILGEVNSWYPTLETPKLDQHQVQLSADQTIKIQGHGHSYKLLAKLLVYQLHPSVQDYDGSTTTSAIASKLYYQISSHARETESRTQVHYLIFPFFVACTELEDEEEQAKVLDFMRQLSGGIATQSCNRMHEFLSLVWAARRIDPGACWFDFVEEGVSFSIGP